MGTVHERRWELGGGGVKNWSKLLTDSTKKLPTWGRGVKIQKNCQRRLWMVPQLGDCRVAKGQNACC